MTFRSSAGIRRASLLLSSAAVALALEATPALAGNVASTALQARVAERSFDIPAGPLDVALTRFSEQSGQQLVYDTDLVRGLRTSGVRGRMDAATALRAVLAGQSLASRSLNATTITIERAPPPGAEYDDGRVLGPVRVEGAQSSAYPGAPTRGDGLAQLGGVRGDQDAEAAGYRAHVATVGAGAQTAIEDIPRSISVLTQDQIDRQDITTIGDAVRRLPGVAVIEYGAIESPDRGATISSRGFGINQIQLDGGAPLPLNMIGNGGIDLTAYERVELVRGPNGLFTGVGSPGGSLNLVRKRPGAVQSTQIDALIGSFDRQRLEFDYSTPRIGGSNLAFRGVVSAESREYFYDRAETSTASLYGILDAPMGDKARLELGLQHAIREETAPYSGAPRYWDGPLIEELGYNANLASDWSYSDSTQSEIFARLFVDVLEDVDLQVGFDIQRTEEKALLTVPATAIVSSGVVVGQLGVSAGYRSAERMAYSANFRLTGRRTWGDFSHNFYIGGDLSEYDIGKQDSRYALNSLYVATIDEFVGALNSYEPVMADFGPYATPGGSQTNSSLVIGDTVSWKDRIDLSFGARLNIYEQSNASISQSYLTGEPGSLTLPEVGQGAKDFEGDWTPTWSVAVRPLSGLTLYGTAAQGTEEIDGARYAPDGSVLPPTSYENLEVGAKYSRNGWLATLAYYDARQYNVATAIPNSICPPANSDWTPCYELQGDAQTRGWEFELTGELFDGLNISANFTHAEAIYASTGVNRQTEAPVDSANLLIDWAPAALPRWEFRGGLRYRSEVARTGLTYVYDPDVGTIVDVVPFSFAEDAYLVMDAGARYALSDQVSLDLYVENVADEQYISTINGPRYGNIVGPPRTFTLTVRWKRDGERSATGGGLVPFGDAADWYAAFDTGVHDVADLDAEASGLSLDGVTPVAWSFEMEEEKPSISARLGYRLFDHLRVELETAYRSAAAGDIGGGAAAPFGVCGASFSAYNAPFDCDDAVGDMSAWSLMSNLIHDFGKPGRRLRSYLGVGMGLVRSSMDFSGKLEGIGSDDPWSIFGLFPDGTRMTQEGIAGESTDLAAAFQLMAGVSLTLSDQATVDVGYRYFNAPEISWDSFNLDRDSAQGIPTVYPSRVGSFSASLEDHAFTVGLRWAFGSR